MKNVTILVLIAVVLCSSQPSPFHHPISGSERQHPPGTLELGPAESSKTINVTIVIRGQNVTFTNTTPTIEETGCHFDDIDLILDFAENNNLVVVDISQPGRTVKLSGTVGEINTAFGVILKNYHHPVHNITYRGHTGAVYVHPTIIGSVVAVVGLDTRPISHRMGVQTSNRYIRSHTPAQIASLYNFPKNVNGAGQCVAILEFGGGYHTTDLTNPTHVIAVGIDGATNNVTDVDNDSEVALDIQMVEGIATGANIVVYFAPNTDQGWVDAVTRATTDSSNCQGSTLRAVSISWGGPENTWDRPTISASNNAFGSASSRGIVIFSASGDAGSSDGEPGRHVDFPASSPNVAGTGATTLYDNGVSIVGETVWNNNIGATGGGVSAVFAKPSFQSRVYVPRGINGFIGRGVPDVSGDGDPDSGVLVNVNGNSVLIGGTSMVAPMWAALVALMSQSLGRGFVNFNSQIYSIPSSSNAFRDINSGNNGAYSAVVGWDPTTGLGSPNGVNLLSALAGIKQGGSGCN